MSLKKKQKCLDVDQWARDAWKNGNKNDMAKLLMDANWDKAGFSFVVRPFSSFFNFWKNLYIHLLPCPEDQFLVRLDIVIRKKSSKKFTIEEEWLSEKEMKDDYGWSAPFGNIFRII